MTVNAARRSLLKITFYVTTVLTFMFDIDQAEGLRWVKTPSDITKCADETLNVTWEYEKDENEDIRQFQWRFNSSTLIAYRSLHNGLHIDPKYIGRVEESGVTGIMLKNITTKDKGSYSLYIIIAWKETPVIQSMWLNVIDAEAVTIPQWCTCERLPISREWNGGKNINIVTDGCRLEVNASHCCIREPANSCTDKNPQDLCRPYPGPITQIENVTSVRNTNQLIENDTQNGLVTEGSKYKDTEVNTVNTVLLIALSAAILIMFFISIVLIVIFIYWHWRKRRLCTKECQKANIKSADIKEQDEEQRTHMLTGNNDLKLHPCLGNQGIDEKGETLSRLECVSRLSECDDDNDYATFGKTGNSFSGPDLTFDIKVRHNMLWTCDEMEIPALDWSDTGTKTNHVPADKARNNRDIFFSGNRRHVVGANDKGRNNQNYQNISLNAYYDSSDFKKTGDAQLTYVDLHFDDTPRSPKPIQIIENTLV